MWLKLRRARRIAAIRRQIAWLGSADAAQVDATMPSKAGQSIDFKSAKPTRSDNFLAALFAGKSSRGTGK